VEGKLETMGSLIIKVILFVPLCLCLGPSGAGSALELFKAGWTGDLVNAGGMAIDLLSFCALAFKSILEGGIAP
jgi:hypothetical protein